MNFLNKLFGKEDLDALIGGEGGLDTNDKG